MRSRILPAVGISAVALAVAFSFAGSASAAGHTVGTAAKGATHTKSAQPAKSCVNQADNDNGVGIVSQNFEASFDIYDAQGADDFKVKTKCKIATVHADGIYFNGSGPAASWDVTFYKGKSAPGGVAKACTGATATSDNFGTVDIKCKAKLKKGAYWASVVANMDFSAGGEWGWNTNNTQRGKAAMWQNPGNGFSSGCTTWGNMQSCIGALGQGPDFSFSLS